MKTTWTWNIPTHFNIGVACSDRHCNTPSEHSIAMIVEDDTQGTSTITFAELSAQTNRFMNVLREAGIEVGERVLIRLPNSLAYPIAFLGAMKAGCISVPTSTLLTANEVAYLASDSAASVMVTDYATWQALAGRVAEFAQLRLVLLNDTQDTNATQVGHVRVQSLYASLAQTNASGQAYPSLADDPAYLVYTSGTTGYPKGVLHAHRALLGRQPASQYWFDYDHTQQDRIMHSGKFNWTYVLGSGLMDPLYLGKTVIVHEGKNDAMLWIRLIAKHQATIFIGVPTIYRQIIQKTQADKASVPSIRHFMSAGEHLSDEVFSAWKTRFGRGIYEAVGMSEFSYYLSQNIHHPIRPGSAGFAQPGHEIALLDPETRTPVTVGEEGMICVPENDPALFLSYWNMPEETAKYKHNGWFFTGDYARYDADGYIWFLGRKDDIIKSFGYRVSPYEIERVYKSHSSVADCAVVGEELEKDKVLVVIYVILHPDCQTSADELLAFGQANLASYKAPKTVYLVQDFPRTKNGKILRKDIRAEAAYARSTR